VVIGNNGVTVCGLNSTILTTGPPKITWKTTKCKNTPCIY